jgi:hypothetical protein
MVYGAVCCRLTQVLSLFRVANCMYTDGRVYLAGFVYSTGRHVHFSRVIRWMLVSARDCVLAQQLPLTAVGACNASCLFLGHDDDMNATQTFANGSSM